MVSEIERLKDDLLRELRDNEKQKSKRHSETIQILTEINKNIIIMNAARNKPQQGNKTIDERLDHIEHILKVLSKGQQDIKSHLWRQEDQPQQPDEQVNKEIIKQEAINYVNNVLLPDLAQKEAEKGDMVAEGVWLEWAAKPFLEYLKTQALAYIAEALAELKSKLLLLAVDMADWVLSQLENILIRQYENASEPQQKAFKEKIEEKFPNSRLLSKL